MTGLVVLGVVAAYVTVFAFVVRAARNRVEKAAAITLALAIPLWDLPFGLFQYHAYCGKADGLRRMAEVPPQRSIYFTYAGAAPEALLRAGFDAVEFSNPSGGVRRYVRLINGDVAVADHPFPASILQIRRIPERHLGWNVYQRERVLEEIQSRKVIAVAHQYAWRGGWIHNLFQPPSPVAECNADVFRKVVVIALGKK